jgi:hypothetical protein
LKKQREQLAKKEEDHAEKEREVFILFICLFIL